MGILFQSTLPMQGVTYERKDHAWQQAVSIHTPYAGSDDEALPMTEALPAFQSTLPMQGVTAKSGKFIRIPARFRYFT